MAEAADGERWQRLFLRVWGFTSLVYAAFHALDLLRAIGRYRGAGDERAEFWWKAAGQCHAARLCLDLGVGVAFLLHDAAVRRRFVGAATTAVDALFVLRSAGFGCLVSAMLFAINAAQTLLAYPPLPAPLAWPSASWPDSGKVLVLAVVGGWLLLGARQLAGLFLRGLDRPAATPPS